MTCDKAQAIITTEDARNIDRYLRAEVMLHVIHCPTCLAFVERSDDGKPPTRKEAEEAELIADDITRIATEMN